MTRQDYKHYSHLYRNADRLRAQAERYYQDSCAKYWLSQQVGFSTVLPQGTRRVSSACGITAHVTEEDLMQAMQLEHAIENPQRVSVCGLGRLIGS